MSHLSLVENNYVESLSNLSDNQLALEMRRFRRLVEDYQKHPAGEESHYNYLISRKKDLLKEYYRRHHGDNILVFPG